MPIGQIHYLCTFIKILYSHSLFSVNHIPFLTINRKLRAAFHASSQNIPSWHVRPASESYRISRAENCISNPRPPEPIFCSYFLHQGFEQHNMVFLIFYNSFQHCIHTRVCYHLHMHFILAYRPPLRFHIRQKHFFHIFRYV